MAGKGGHPDKAYEKMSSEELADAPGVALERLSKHDTELLGKAFNVRTITDLAESRFVLRAQVIVNLTKVHTAK